MWRHGEQCAEERSGEGLEALRQVRETKASTNLGRVVAVAREGRARGGLDRQRQGPQALRVRLQGGGIAATNRESPVSAAGAFEGNPCDGHTLRPIPNTPALLFARILATFLGPVTQPDTYSQLPGFQKSIA